MEQRNLEAPRVISEWMQRENEASNMIDSDDVSSAHHSSDLLKIQLNRDRSDPTVTKQTYDYGTLVNIIANDQRGDRVHSEPATNYYLKRKFNDYVKNQQVRSGINLKNMKQSKKNAKNRLDNLIRKQRSLLTFQATPYLSANEGKVQFQNDQDSDNDASLTILGGPHQSAGNLPESSVHDRNTEGTLIGAPIDQLHLREASSVNHLAIPTRSRRDRNEVDRNGAKRTDLNTDNLFVETLVNRASERMSDFTVEQDSRESETLSRPGEGDIDVAANRLFDDDSLMDRSERKTVDFEGTKQTHLDDRNIYALDNRSRDTSRSERTVDYLLNDNFNVANESTNLYSPYVGAIAINTVAPNFDVDTFVEDRVEMDEISKIENRTEINMDTDEISTILNCRDSACSESNNNDKAPVFRTRNYSRAKELNDNREDEGYFARVDDVSAMSVSDNDTDINVVDNEAPFTGFEGSQKFPVKINHKSSAQVEKFDRRHFGPQKEDVLEETSTWYPSTVLLDLPKSPSRDVLHRHRKTDDSSDDVGINEEEVIEKNEKQNDTFDEPSDMSLESRWSFSDVKSSSEKLAVTPNIEYDDFENVTKKDKNDSDGRVEIDVTVPRRENTRPIEKTNITILGLFEMTHGAMRRLEGSCELQAAKLAVERVNESDVLKGFRLRLIYNDTKVS